MDLEFAHQPYNTVFIDSDFTDIVTMKSASTKAIYVSSW
jgi:hypothetical protein